MHTCFWLRKRKRDTVVGEDSSDVDDADLQDSDMELDDEFNHKEIQMNAGYLLNTFFPRVFNRFNVPRQTMFRKIILMSVL